MKFLLLLSIFLSLNVFSGSTFFTDELDEFTDEREIQLALSGDENSRFSAEIMAISCGSRGRPILGLSKGIMFSLDTRLLVTLRFEKNEPITKMFSYNSKNSLLYTRDIVFIKEFLYDLRNSNNLIVKIKGETGIMRFSELNESSKHVSEFLNAAQELPQTTCNLN